MGILSASVSLTRYRVADDVPPPFWGEIPDRLAQHAFVDIDASAEERSFGWVSFEDYLDAAFTSGHPQKGEWFAFSLRLDTRRVPPSVMKKHFQLAVNAELEKIDNPEKRYLSKDRKAEIKEQVALRLRSRTWPIPAVFDAAVGVTSGEVWLASTNAKVRNLFEDFFTLTFGLALEPLTPFFLAARMLGEEAVVGLENLEETSFALEAVT
jgi:DNA recombination-dependent growth factor C